MAEVGNLVDDLKSSDPDTRDNAEKELSNLDSAEAVPPLLEALVGAPVAIRETLSEIVSHHLEKAPEIATPLAREMLSNAAEGVRATGAWALGFVGNPMTIPGLLGAIKDKAASVRAAAAGALAIFPDQPESLQTLLSALEDADESVRASAALALGRISNVDAVAPLIQALEDTEAMVRRSAAFALGILNDRTAKPGLQKACEDPDPSVREEAEEALQRMEHSAY